MRSERYPPVELEPKKIRSDMRFFNWTQGLGALGMISSATSCALSPEIDVDCFSSIVFGFSTFATTVSSYGKWQVKRFVTNEAKKLGLEGKNLHEQARNMKLKGDVYIEEGENLLDSLR